MSMTDSVKGIDTEPQAGEDACWNIQRRYGGQTDSVLGGCPKIGFVSPEQDIRTAVSEDDCIDGKQRSEMCVCKAKWPSSCIVEGVNGSCSSVALRKETGKRTLREIFLFSLGISIHLVK